MPIPAFDEMGLLPLGVHDCTLQEIAERFTWNPRRAEIWQGCGRVLEEFAAMAMTYPLFVDGGFVTDREDPSDVDVVLDLRHGAPDAHQRDALFHWHRRRANIKRDHLVDYYPNLPGENDLADYFQYVGIRTAMQKRLTPKSRKGILRVLEWAIG